ncbi:hypothetical protein ALC53_06303, partial [Atta colombica]
VNVFAYKKGEGSARNFSDWLVEESRIEQPDSSCRGKNVDIRNGRTNESEHTTWKRGSTQFHSVSLAFVKNGQPVTGGAFTTSQIAPWRTPLGRERDDARTLANGSESEREKEKRERGETRGGARRGANRAGAVEGENVQVTDRTYLFLLEAVRKRPQDSARHHAVVHPISPAAGRDGGLPSGGHLFPPAGHLLELHQSNVSTHYTLYESSVHLYRAFITLRVRTYRYLYSTFHTVRVFSRFGSGPIEKERKGTWRTVDYDEIKVQASCRQ